MERRRRRFWTWITTGAAGLALTAATASGLFQLAVEAVPGYRADVERYVHEVTGRPVRIGRLDLTWRYTYPSLDLQEVALVGPDGGEEIKAERLRLGFSLQRLLRRDYRPNRLELHGLSLDVHVGVDGQLEISGWQDVEDAPTGSLEPLDNFDQLRLERCRLNLYDDRGRKPRRWSFGLAYAELARGLLSSTLESEMALPAELGESARLDAELSGDWLDLATWSGKWSMELRGVAVGTWLEPFLAKGVEIEARSLNLQGSGTLENGSPRSVELLVESGPVRARRVPHEAAFESLRADARAEFGEMGWSAQLTRFELETAAGRSPDTRVQVKAEGPEGARTLSGQAQQIRLADFAPWLPMTQAPDELMAAGPLSGELDQASFTLEGADEPRYRARARFRNLALPAGDRAVGVAGLRGEVAIDESGGRVILQNSPARLQLPGVLDTPNVPFEALEGEAQWRREGDGWRVNAPRFRWAAAATSGEGRLDLLLPGAAQGSPRMKLEARFSSTDVTQAKPYMPRHWGRDLKTWLDRAIVAGSVPGATLRIDGALEDFPFVRKPGTWELDINVDQALLSFQPDWPPIENLAALAKFRGNGVTVEASGGTVAGNTIQRTVGTIADFKDARLVIDGSARGESARFFDYLSRSPLRQTLAPLLQNRVSGPVSGTLHIDIPLKESNKTSLNGVAEFDNIELKYPGLEEPFKQVRGRVAFSSRHVSAETLEARWYGIPMQARIDVLDDGSSLLSTHLRFPFDAAGNGPSSLVPAWLRGQLEGDSQWAAALRIRGPADDPPLRLSTDLVGAEVRLPAPLGKSAGDSRPLELSLRETSSAPLELRMEYDGVFGADVLFRKRGRELAMYSTALRLGPGPPIEASEPGLSLGGTAPEIDVRAWYEALERMKLIGSGEGLLRGADLNLGRAVWGDYSVADTRYQWQPDKGGGWRMAVVGAGASGDLQWTPGNGGQLRARLGSLNLESDEKPEEGRPPGDPGQWPVVDIDVEKFRLNRADLGRLQLVSERIDQGQRTRTLMLTGGIVSLSAGGDWRRTTRGSSGNLEFDLSTTDIASLLRALHYARNLEARNGNLRGTVAWDDAPGGLDWRQARGTVKVSFSDGQLRAVEPGAGRVLGLMNFMALPRRLTLNFSDVVSDGLGFDTIKGDFQLADGNARTDNLTVDGPSVRMDTRGRIGLAARDYDQEVTVYPGVSAGVTLGALALGGPVIAVLTLIAQEIMDKPLDEVSQLTYHLTGSWDNPQVERAGGSGDAQDSHKRKPGPPSQK